jgi:acetyl esterase
MSANTPYVRPDVVNLLAMLAAQPGPKLSEISPAEGRAMMTGMTQMLERPRGDITTADLVIPGSIKARLYTPSDDAGPVLIYYHGGGWVIGDLDTHDPLCAEIARQLGMRVVSIDYRMAPEAPFPAAAEDCISATRWIAGSPAELGAAVTGVIPAGDSAGGNLAAAVRLDGLVPCSLHEGFRRQVAPSVGQSTSCGNACRFAADNGVYLRA